MKIKLCSHSKNLTNFAENHMTCLDKTFCVSPECNNKCGRKLTDKIKQEANKVNRLISTAYFCKKSELISVDINNKLISK